VLLRWVRLGKDYGDRVEILSGLRNGETYVVNGGQRLLDGQPVEATSRTLGER
jgi:multidrug efflux pump subunit AcrA (membrane-fusion protein)